MKPKLITQRPMKGAPAFEAGIIPEPLLLFGGRHEHVDPKTGLSLYGPYSMAGQARPAITSVIVGMVGPASMIADAEQFLGSCRHQLLNDGKQPFLYPHFPGFTSDPPFHCDFVYGETWQESIKKEDIEKLLQDPDHQNRIRGIIGLYVEAMEVLSRQDPKPSVVLCCIPQDIYDACQLDGKPWRPKKEKKTGSRLAKPHEGKNTEVDDEEDDITEHKNLRRGLKAECMRFDMPTQLVLPRSLVLSTIATGKVAQDVATRAWNLTTALYHKAGGSPWRLASIESGVCFVGVSFYKEILSQTQSMRTSMAQAFTSTGDGYVLRGQSFRWNSAKDGNSPHLDETSAQTLLSDVLELYKKQNKGSLPKRLVIHKTSRFWPEELRGFKTASSLIPQTDFVAIGRRGIQFYRRGDYPPLRGTYVKFSEQNLVLYTSGYIPYLRTYPGARVPQPLEILEHHGDSPWTTVLTELLAMTKMNWNTADFAGKSPVSIAFSRRVSEILAELHPDSPVRAEYRYYM